MLKVITVTNQPERAAPLLNSLEKFKWHTELLITEWKGFGTKLITTYEYLKAHPEVTEFIFCDAHDVIVLATPEEFMGKIFHKEGLNTSAEKGLWPPIMHPFRNLYTITKFGFDFPNSGCYYSPSGEFIRLFEKYPPFYEIDDQFWMHMLYLNNEICLDTTQYLFNSHSFIEDGEYKFENGRVTMKTGSPCFIHGNGQTDMTKIHELLK